MKLPAFTFHLHRMKINGRKHNAPKGTKRLELTLICDASGEQRVARFPFFAVDPKEVTFKSLGRDIRSEIKRGGDHASELRRVLGIK